MKIQITKQDFASEDKLTKLVSVRILKSDLELIKVLGSGTYTRGFRKLLDVLRPSITRTVKEIKEVS